MTAPQVYSPSSKGHSISASSLLITVWCKQSLQWFDKNKKLERQATIHLMTNNEACEYSLEVACIPINRSYILAELVYTSFENHSLPRLYISEANHAFKLLFVSSQLSFFSFHQFAIILLSFSFLAFLLFDFILKVKLIRCRFVVFPSCINTNCMQLYVQYIAPD